MSQRLEGKKLEFQPEGFVAEILTDAHELRDGGTLLTGHAELPLQVSASWPIKIRMPGLLARFFLLSGS